MSVPNPLSLPSNFLGTENVTLNARNGEGNYTSYTLSGAKLMPSADLIEESSLGGRSSFLRTRTGTWILWQSDLSSGLVPSNHPRPGDQIVQSGGSVWVLTDSNHRPLVGNYFCNASFPVTSG